MDGAGCADAELRHDGNELGTWRLCLHRYGHALPLGIESPLAEVPWPASGDGQRILPGPAPGEKVEEGQGDRPASAVFSNAQVSNLGMAFLEPYLGTVFLQLAPAAHS